MNYQWRDASGNLSNYCDFTDDLVIEFTATVLKGTVIVVNRTRDQYIKSNDDMYIEAFAEIASRWRLLDKDIVPHNGDPKYLEALIRVELSVPSNQEGGFTLFPHIRIPSERTLPIPHMEILLGYKEFDEYYYKNMLPVCVEKEWWVRYIWKECVIDGMRVMGGTPWVGFSSYKDEEGNIKPLSLKIQILRRISFFNEAFAGDENGPTQVHSMSNLYPEKIPKMLSKLGKETRFIKDPMRTLKHLIPGALTAMTNAMNTSRFIRTQKWNFNEELEKSIAKVRKHTSAGIRAGPKITEKDEYFRTTYSTSGKKLEQIEYVRRQIDITKQEILKDSQYVPQDVGCVIVPKDEMKSKAGMSAEDAKDEDSKVRAYFIPCVFQYIMAAMIMGFRQIIERGHVIKIGMNFWWGGAMNLAMQMCYNDPDIIFEDGDFRALDTTIHLILLIFYVNAARAYYDVASMSHETLTLFEAFFRIVAERLSIKVTHIFSTIWRVVYGGMPSGAYETSHGDSWIVTFLYFMYVEWVIENNPHRKNQILELFRKRLVGIIVYGDDHVLFTHKSIHDIINEKGFANFVKYYWGMEIRNIHTAKFISEVHYTGGVLVRPGIVFLKRYFVNASNVFTPGEMIRYNITSPVLPFRPIHALTNKYAYGKGETKSILEYAVSAIGMAYDTQGTNRAGYVFCEIMYRRALKVLDGDPRDAINKYLYELRMSGRDTYITRVMRTLNLSDEDIVAGFPEWESLITRHYYDGVRCQFGGLGKDPAMQGMMW